MNANNLLTLDYSYLSLPESLYRLVQPSIFPAPELVLFNDALGDELGLTAEGKADVVALALGKEPAGGSQTYAQAYAGHQFGYFAKLGDGRAIMLGEYVAENNQHVDIQLKGSGRTPYSRGGDGKATLKAMLREYLISEAMHGLGIASSRSLAVLKTGERVYRESVQDGAALVRVMSSHIRVGTFEYASHLGTVADLRALAAYTARRLYPAIEQDEHLAIRLLQAVMERQIALVADWMRVGFIHGVMNTDNTSISGETFDYGPCAFMNAYHPDTVFSSIDRDGRYAFGHQPDIIKWNITRFAEALLPIIHPDPDTSLRMAQSVIDQFDDIWHAEYYYKMLGKIGIADCNPHTCQLLDDLLGLMKQHKMDYTNTFRGLLQELDSKGTPKDSLAFAAWLERWRNMFGSASEVQQAKQLMMTSNPVYIPRNDFVELALDDAAEGNMDLFRNLLGVLSHPYTQQDGLDRFMAPPDPDFERGYQTFCGT